MKILILGAKGQLGTALVDRCQLENLSFTPAGRDLVDVTDLEKLKRYLGTNPFTHLINCAAYTDVDGAEINAKEAFAVNALGAENIGVVARENGLRVVHVSTDYIFDGETDTSYVEDDRPNPINTYGKSKWEGEERLLSEFHQACIVRTSWIFGHLGKNFISSMLLKLQDEEQVYAIEDQLNRATYNRDLAKALIDLCCHSGIFHFANSHPLSRFQIALDFFERAKARGIPLKCQKILPAALKDFPSPSPRPKNSVLNTKKVSLTLGRKPRSWETILNDYFEHCFPHA